MKTQRLIRFMAPLMLLGFLSRIALAAPAPDAPPSPPGPKAGKITALLPTAHVIRGEGKKAVTSDAVKGEDLIWQDLVRTDKGGRARITLNDQSILSLGSQAELRIVKHDAQAQQTSLEMTFGRIRAQVSTVTRDGGSFQIHTPTAVAGVIGTDFGTDASEPGITTFVCMSGIVQVGNSDPSVPGTVPCTAGQTTTVKSGLPPTPPKSATQQQINQVITDTEPASISAFAPASALIGTSLDAAATGTHMSGINGVTISGAGVQVTLGANGTDSAATAHLVISSTAQAGPRTVTFTKSNGANTAAIFTVIAPPGLQGTDAASLKKRYTDILTTEQQAADTSNASLKASLQQESDQGLQAIQQNNTKLPQPLSTSQLSQQLAAIVSNFNAAGSNRETQAMSTASAAVDQIVAAMESKIQDGSEPVANVAADLDKQFAPINQTFQAALNQIHTDLAALVATSIQQIDQLIANFQQTITAALQQQAAPPTPKVDADDRSVEFGSATSFDAGGSTALSGATIMSTTWTLCDPSYRPPQVGVVLPANAPLCRAVPGFAASSNQFQFSTCGLAPADYIARVTVVDSNGKSSAMDVRLHVTAPVYDDPPTRIQNLAAAYISLQSQQFLAFFDSTAYPGYTQLSENIRDTFLNLSSMLINVRVSQSNLNCNDATVRADWDQNYTFKNDQSCVNAAAGSSCQKQLFTQHEQLTVRMTRRPGSGWYIVDFQGDNGKVQGAAPGPQTTFTPPSAGTVDLAVGTIAFTNPYIEGQTAEVDVPITNVGTAPSAASSGNLVISVPDISNLVLATANIPAIPALGNVIVPVQFTIPTQANLLGAHTVKAFISPPAVGDSDVANDSATTTAPLNFVAPIIDLQISALSFTQGQPPFTAGENHAVSFTVKNNGNLPSNAADSVACNLVNGANSAALGTPVTLGVIGPGATSAVIPVNFTVPASTPQKNFGGQSSVVCTVSQVAGDGPTPTADKTQSLGAFINVVDLAINGISAATSLIGGQAGTLNVSITNNGSIASVASKGNLVLTIAGVSGNVATADIPSITPGGTVPVPLLFTVPNVSGQQSLTVTISPSSPGDINAANESTTASLIFAAPSVDLQIGALSFTQGQPPFTAGENHAVSFTVKDNGDLPSNAADTAACNLVNGAASAALGSPVTLGAINPGATTAAVSVSFTVPASTLQQSFGGNSSVVCTVSEVPSDGPSPTADKTQALPAFINVVNLTIGNIAAAASLIATQPGTLNVPITNNGSAASSAVNLVLTSPDFAGTLGTANIASIAAGATVAVPLPFTVPNSSGQHNLTVTIISAGNIDAANNSATTSFTFASSGTSYAVTSIATANTPNPPTGANALQVGQNVTVQVTVANTGANSPSGNITVQLTCTPQCQFNSALSATIPAPSAGQSAVATIVVQNLQLPPATGYQATVTITAAPPSSTVSGNSIAFDVTDFGLTASTTLSDGTTLNGDLNVPIAGSSGIFNVALTESPATLSYNVPAAVGPTTSGVTYSLSSSLAPGSNAITVSATGSAPAGTPVPVTVTATRFGASHTVTQSVCFFAASLDNFSPGQPGNSANNAIVLPINGASTTVDLRLTGNFPCSLSSPKAAQLVLPTPIAGIAVTSTLTTLSVGGGDVPVTIQATQGADTTKPAQLTFQAVIPNTNPPVKENLSVFVRPTALPDLAVTAVAFSGRNFTANPLLSGEPVDAVVTVANKGFGATQGFERLHVLLNGVELTNSGVTVPQSLAPITSASGNSVNIAVHLVAPDPVPNGPATITAKVNEDPIGDLDPTNDSLGVAIATSDWTLGTNTGANGGNSDGNPLVVTSGTSNATFVQPVILGTGDFFTPVTVLNGIVSSRITATPSLASFTSTRQQIGYTINASSTAAAGFYAAQLIARFVDGGRPTAQRQATIHIQVSNAANPGDTVTVTSNRNNACTSGCPAVQINGLLIENVGLTPTRLTGSTGSVDLHFTDPPSLLSNVTASGNFQSPILNGIPYGVAANVLFAAAQDTTGAISPGAAQVTVSATSIQTSAMQGAPSPEPVGPNQTTLQFNIGDLQLVSQPCFNLAPGVEGVLQLTFTPVSGFNVPSISWSVASLPPGVVLNSVTPASTFSGGSYAPVSIDLSNTNPTDITTTQSLTLLGSLSNNNGSATVAFAPAIQLHSGTCSAAQARNAMIESGSVPMGTRGVWKRGNSAASVARANSVRDAAPSATDVRLIANDVSYTPSMPKAGDNVQVRFRLTNPSTTDAHDVPVSLLINGMVVVSDGFDVGAGKTVLGGLIWNNAQLPRTGSVSGGVTANLVVDAAHNAHATVASGKIAPLAHFTFAGEVSRVGILAGISSGRQRASLQIAEAACAGFRFSSGANASCGSSDVEIAFEDAASGRFSLSASHGISDLGPAYNGNTAPANVQFTSQMTAMAGHSYAVQLDGGKVGVLTIRSINNPRQTSATANKVFHGGAAQQVARKLGKAGGPVETGEVSGAPTQTVVATLELLYDNP